MGMHDHLTYAILSKSDVDNLSQNDRDEMFSTIHGEYDDQRLSLDETDMVVKWTTSDGEPDNIPSHTTYTHSQVITELAGEDWTEDI